MKTPDEIAYEVCHKMEAIMLGMGIGTTAHYDAGLAVIAIAIRGVIEECAKVADQEALLAGMRAQPIGDTAATVAVKIADGIRALKGEPTP